MKLKVPCILLLTSMILTGCGPSMDEVRAAAHYQGSANVYKLLLEKLNEGTLKQETLDFALKTHDDDLAKGKQMFPGPNWDQPTQGKAREAHQNYLAAKKAFEEELAKKTAAK